MKILKNYIFYFLVFLIVCFYGVLHPKAESITVNFTNLVTSASDYSNSIQCNNINCIVNNVSYLFNQDFTTRWTASSSKSCSNGVYITGKYSLEGGSNWVITPSWLDDNLKQVFIDSNNYRYSCNYSLDNSGDYSNINYSCYVPSITQTFTLGYIFKQSSTSSTPGTAQVIANRILNYECDNSASQIINNNNQNTQNIINNNNSNTQDIINNQNSNTQQQIESQRVCRSFFINSHTDFTFNNSYLDANGIVNSTDEDFGVTDFYSIGINTSLVVSKKSTAGGRRYCFYDFNKEFISCNQGNQYNVGTDITIPNNAKYIRFTIDKSQDAPNFNFYTCQDGNQALDDSINGLNDSIKDDDIGDSTSDAADFILDFNTNTFGLTGIITAPLNLIQSLTSSSCSELRLPLPFLNNQYLVLPCMTSIYQQHFGIFFTMYQTITYGIIAYWVIVRIFNYVKDFKNPEHDEIEVVDL